MQDYLHASLWPGAAVPVPLVPKVAETAVEGPWIHWSRALTEDGEDERLVELPVDFYLQEMTDFRPTSQDASAEFLRANGPLCRPHFASLPEVDRLRADFMVAEPENAGAGSRLQTFHYIEVMLHMRSWRLLMNTWMKIQAEGVEDIAAAAGRAPLALSMAEPVSEAEYAEVTEWLSLNDFMQRLNAGLSGFHIGLGGLQKREAGVYEIACLQLYNHIATQARVQYCANETCRKPFVSQRGTAKYYHREDVRFHTHQCAKTQTQRERRRRNRAASNDTPREEQG